MRARARARASERARARERVLIVEREAGGASEQEEPRNAYATTKIGFKRL